MLTLLNPRNVFAEKMILNGMDLTLQLGLVNMPIADVLVDLKHSFPSAQYASSSNTLLVKHKLSNGWNQRILLIYFGERFPILQFSMLLPPTIPSVLEWPHGLPITSDGKPLRVIAMPAKKSWYGSFRTSQSPAAALSDIGAGLRADGWISFTGEASSALHGKGELYIKKQPLSIMLVSFTEDGIGTVYTRPCRK
ncbi:MAG: hypothetical protein GY750_00135 [Lentisphaerae bacterium]|nr:hypothetical protein [Lentisphaerota bacterium]